MSDSATISATRAKWVGTERDVRSKEADASGQRPVVHTAPAEYLQYRDIDGVMHNVPARDLTDEDWAILPAAGRAAVKDSSLYVVSSDKEHAERRKAAAVKAITAEPVVAVPTEGA